MPEIIDSFRGEYRFLSNFYPDEVWLDGEKYPTVEHAFQAAKTQDVYMRIKIKSAPEPSMAKRLGRQVVLRPDWEDKKVYVMLDLLRQKFSNSVLKVKLLATGDATLVEGNNWGDTFWGSVIGKGQNMLGILLHVVRYELRTESGKSFYHPDPGEEPF